MMLDPNAQNRNNLLTHTLTQLDLLDGHSFESYVAELLRRQGYIVTRTKTSGDLGVDLVAEKYPLRYAVQVKRQSAPVSRRAVSDAVAGKAYYACNAAMVITNNYFSRGAVELARATGCQLVDRDELTHWIRASGGAPAQIARWLPFVANLPARWQIPLLVGLISFLLTAAVLFSLLVVYHNLFQNGTSWWLYH